MENLFNKKKFEGHKTPIAFLIKCRLAMSFPDVYWDVSEEYKL